jgi:4-hydroxy-tetrahydrodipicolinate synthase
VENIIGVKDSSGDLSITSEIIRQTSDIDFKVFCGKDTLIFTALAIGCAGAVPTMNNFVGPIVREIWDKFQAGDYKGARDAQFRMNPLRLAMDFTSFPTGAKDMANLLGLDLGSPFLPNTDTIGPALDHMKKALTEAGYTVADIGR